MSDAAQTNGHSSIEAENTQNGFHDDRWQEVQIPVPWGYVAGKWWGSRERQPVICIHGWQDNAGTFDRLIPLLPDHLSYLCIDLPGHGKSSHYPSGMQYYLFWDGISLIRRIVKLHKWTKISLIGHSLGGALSFMYAASFPEDTNCFISIDINGPPVRDHRKQAANTGLAIDRLLKYETLPESMMPCYNYDDMIDLVLDAYEGSVDRDCVQVLMKRGMAPAPKHLHKEGFHFVRDLRLKVSGLAMLTEEQVLAYADLIKCRVLNIRAIPGMKLEKPQVYENVIKAMRKNASVVDYKEIPGTHHLHLVTPERVATIIGEFLEA